MENTFTRSADARTKCAQQRTGPRPEQVPPRPYLFVRKILFEFEKKMCETSNNYDYGNISRTYKTQKSRIKVCLRPVARRSSDAQANLPGTRMAAFCMESGIRVVPTLNPPLPTLGPSERVIILSLHQINTIFFISRP